MATETNINNINKSQVRERNNEQYLTQCLLQHYNCLITINKGKKKSHLKYSIFIFFLKFVGYQLLPMYILSLLV